MALEKLTITPERGAPIRAMFNPERYSISKSVQFAESGIPGLDSPVVQYVRGQAEKANFELFFDTTDEGTVSPRDVRDETVKVTGLLRVDGETHAPLRVKLSWGASQRILCFGSRVNPWCVLESANQEFLLFAPGGIPVRAKVAVVFREAWTVEQQLQETPRHSSDRTKTRVVRRGDTLPRIAAEEYGDPAAWRAIAEGPENAMADPARLVPGMTLVVPSLTDREAR
ncbi:MAG TPA: hypothetical protein VG937_10520 [Polyangiaceae bacterium]|nr:hypothetical protein [Polyangiaceae bacterium]